MVWMQRQRPRHLIGDAPALRQAVREAIDPSVISDRVYQGDGITTSGIKRDVTTETRSGQLLNDVEVEPNYDIAAWGFAFSDPVPFSTLNESSYSTSVSNVPVPLFDKPWLS